MFSSQTIIPMLLSAALSYMLGSLNFAIIISRMFAKDDIRSHGSGNAGMTNILRTYGKKPAAATALGDFFKAVAAIAVSRYIFKLYGVTFMDAGYVSGLFVLLGHLFPVYFGFKGGKGVVTTLGVILLVNPVVFLILAAVFIPFVFIARIVSLASVIGAVAFPAVTWLVACFRGREALFDTLFACLIGAIILFMHRENIRRLLSGQEHRFGEKNNRPR